MAAKPWFVSEQPAVLLTKFLTGHRVVEASLHLQRGSPSQRADAVEFFALREAFGVRGWARPSEALLAIVDTIARLPTIDQVSIMNRYVQEHFHVPSPGAVSDQDGAAGQLPG